MNRSKQPSTTAVPFCAAVVICVALGSHLTPRKLLPAMTVPMLRNVAA
jgi:hypothetical protein